MVLLLLKHTGSCMLQKNNGRAQNKLNKSEIMSAEGPCMGLRNEQDCGLNYKTT